MAFSVLQKTLVLGGIALALSGCKTEFHGVTNVKERTTVKLKKGSGTLNPGRYSSTLKFTSKKKATLELHTAGSRNNPELPIAIPKYAQVPEYNGPISWKAEEIGQTFDVEGSLNTRITDSGRRRGTESCAEQVPYRECFRDRHGYPVCRTGWRTEHGWRDVEYFDRYIERDLYMNLLEPRTRRGIGDLSGKNTETERVVTWASRCRVPGYPYPYGW